MIHHGDVRTILPTLKAGSVQCVVTSPPYWGLRDYGVTGQIGLEPTPEAYVENMVQVFREVKRVLRDDGTVWLNLGDSYNSTSGFSRANKQWARKGRDGGANDKKEIKHPTLKTKDLIGIPWRVAFALQADGWYLRSDIVWHKPNPMPESVTDRPTKSHEYLFLLTKSVQYYYDAEAVREPAQDSKSGRNLRSVWTINPKPYAEAHFATFPEKLVEPCVKAGTKHGDTVLDPFAGSGTTGLVAGKLGREFVGIELNADYITLAHDRIEGPLFSRHSTNK